MDNIIIKYNNGKFIFYDKNDIELEHFSPSDVIKYIKNEFPTNPDTAAIKTYVLTKNGIVEHSKFTGNIDLLMKLYIGMQSEPDAEHPEIRNILFLILEEIIKLALIISNHIKEDQTKNELKLSVVQYSSFAISKMFHMIHNNKEDVEQIQHNIKILETTKKQLIEKINTLTTSVNTQNEQIGHLTGIKQSENNCSYDEAGSECSHIDYLTEVAP